MEAASAVFNEVLNEAVFYEAAEFYRSVIASINPFGSIRISQLLSHRTKAPDHIYYCVNSLEELKLLLNLYSEFFVVTEEYVSLREVSFPTESKLEMFNGDISKLVYKYFESIIIKKNSFIPIPVHSFLGHRAQAPEAVRNAVKTPEDLCAYLKKHTNVFCFYNNHVIYSPALKNINNLIQVCASTLRLHPSLTCCYADIMKNESIKSVLAELKISDVIQLKKIFACFSNIFKTNTTTVTLIGDAIVIKPESETQYHYSSTELQDICKKIELNALKFYKSLISKSPTELCPITSLIEHRMTASPDVQDYIKNPEDLKKFLKRHPEEFIVGKKCVQIKNNEKLESKAVKFYKSLIISKSPTEPYPITSLIEPTCQAPHLHDYIKNPIGINKFLMRHPEEFIVEDGFVKINKKIGTQTGMSSNSKKETLTEPSILGEEISIKPESGTQPLSSSTKCQDTDEKIESKVVKFYQTIIILKSPTAPYPITSLIEHRAPPDVLDYIRNPEELKEFLMRHPEEFIVENNCVKIDINTEKLESNAVKFYKSQIISKSPTAPYLITSLFGHRMLAPPDVCDYIQNPKGLKKFLKRHPEEFIVENGYVKINEKIDTKKISSNTKKETFPEPCIIGKEISLKPESGTKPFPSNSKCQDTHEKIESKAVKFYKSLIINKSPTAPYPITSLIGHRMTASPNVRDYVKNPEGLKQFLMRHPEEFIVENGCVEINKKNTAKNTSNAASDTSSTCSDFSNTLEKFRGLQISAPVKSMKDKVDLTSKNTISGSKNYESGMLPEGHKEVMDPAAKFFLYVLWRYKPFNVVPIVELMKYKHTAPKEIQVPCGQSLDEFKNFLHQYPECFIVTGEYVLSRKNIPPKTWSPPYKGIEEPLCSLLLKFFVSYTLHSKPLSIEKLYNEVGNCFVLNNGKKCFDTWKELSDFLEMFPEIFYIFNNQVVNLQNCDKKNKNKNKKNSEINNKKPKEQETVVVSDDSTNDAEEEEGDEDALSDSVEGVESSSEVNKSLRDVILRRTELIEDVETSIEVVEILLDEEYIALDCEGFSLGADGVLSLVQIGTACGDVYIFDVLHNREIMTEGNLKEICESKSIIKVVHDCRNDSANLYHEFDVKLTNIFDTRVAHGLISGIYNRPIGFNDLCKYYGGPINIEKDEFKDIYKTQPRFWLNRPLTDSMLSYAALDVASLVPHVFNDMKSKLKCSMDRVLLLSEKASKSAL